MADKSVQLVVTSPPFWGLRAYGTKPVVWGGREDCEHEWAESKQFGMTGGTAKVGINGGKSAYQEATMFDSKTTALCVLCGALRCELGSEPTVQGFISHLVEVLRECRRVLRDDGICFVNIADSYCNSGKGPTGKNGLGDQSKRQGFHDQVSDGRPKSLALVPERLAIALSDDGWIIRSRIAWCKAAPMPESVRDRPTSAWEHILMLTKQARYYYDVDAVREPHAEKSFTVHTTPRKGNGTESTGEKFNKWLEDTGKGRVLNPAGANQRNWWLLPPDPYPGAHFATFPREIPRRCILAATSEYGACAACGAPWKRLVERESSWPDRKAAGGTAGNVGVSETYQNGVHGTKRDHNLGGGTVQQRGWATTCKCGSSAGVRPCVVLDPFAGSFTTPFVAASLGRVGIGVELSPDYIAQARYGRLAQDFLPFDVPAPEPTALPLTLDAEASA